jgi:hypothetical protein
MFDTNVAQLFADNGNLSINVTIYLCWRCHSAPASDDEWVGERSNLLSGVTNELMT